jgi:L-fucose/D-arabinose isomerase
MICVQKTVIHKIFAGRIDSTWPTTWFAPILTCKGAFTSTYEIMNG